MPARHARRLALLLGAAVVLAASPAAASPEQPAVPTPEVTERREATELPTEPLPEPAVESARGEAAQPSPPPSPSASPSTQVQAAQPSPQLAPERLVSVFSRAGALGSDGGLDQDGRSNPARPGNIIGMGLIVFNDGPAAEFVVTVTLPPEMTLISYDGGLFPQNCSGNVCRGIIGTRPGDPDNAVYLNLQARLSPSFRGASTTLRADLQDDANADPSRRTTTSVVAVEQPAGGTPAAGFASPRGGGSAPATPATGSASRSDASSAQTAAQTLPVTGGRTTLVALLALSALGLGVAAQLAGRHRPAATLD